MNILVACEESQAVCVEMRRLGHRAFSCDIQECSGGHPEWHIQGDVLPLLNGNCEFQTADTHTHTQAGRWDMIIAFPPCTYMTKASACRMFPRAGIADKDRYKKALSAKDFFLKIFHADCEKIAIENPTPLKIVGLPEHTQVIQPYMFGEPYSKRTLLWLKGLPLLSSTNAVRQYSVFVPSNTSKHSRGGGGGAGVAQNQRSRSKTFPGVARAMAEQWAGKMEIPNES